MRDRIERGISFEDPPDAKAVNAVIAITWRRSLTVESMFYKDCETV